MGQLRTANRRQRRATRMHETRKSIESMPPTFLTEPAGAIGSSTRSSASSKPLADTSIEVVDTALIPGGGLLQLVRCGGNFSIQFDADELMGSCDHVSEEALATMTCDRLAGRGDDILVGGLGMGFTLRAALAAWPTTTRIAVAELVPEIIGWAEDQLAHLHGDTLSDPRLTIDVADVHDVIASETAGYDAILLDVDNGPDGFMRVENDRIYCAWGLASAYGALRPGGILAVWSAYRDADFQPRLEDAGFSVEEAQVPAFAGSRDQRHYIWFASKTPPRHQRGKYAELAQ